MFSAGLLRNTATKKFLETTLRLMWPLFDSPLFTMPVFMHFINRAKLHLQFATSYKHFLSILFLLTHYHDWAQWIQTVVSLRFRFITCYSWCIKILLKIFLLLFWKHPWSCTGGYKKVLKMANVVILQDSMDLLSQILLWLTLINL